MATGSERVFDPLVRIGHWAGALAFLVAYVTAGRPLTLHARVGYVLAAYALWRLVWGLVGPSRARFSELLSSPRAYFDDLRGLVTARPIPYRGLGPVGSLLAVAYTWRVVEAAYFQEPEGDSALVTEAPLSMVAPMWILIGASVYFGVSATFTGEISMRAAKSLLGGAP